jgi:hypothetical protein
MDPGSRTLFYSVEARIMGLGLHKGNQDTGPCSIQMESGYRAVFSTNGDQYIGSCSMHMEPGHRPVFYTNGTGTQGCVLY